MDYCKNLYVLALIVSASGARMDLILEESECSKEEKVLCRTDVPGNVCSHDRMFGQHICTCDYRQGFALHLHSDWSGYTHRCVRYECSAEGKTYCQTALGNDCEVIAENEIRCLCKQGFVPAEGDLAKQQGCLRKDCLELEKSKKCRTHRGGNICHEDTGGEYHCTCDEPGFQVTEDGKQCFSIKCDDPHDQVSCRTLYEGNSCIMVDGRYRQCICNEPRFHIRVDAVTNNTECWLTGCTAEQNATCDPFNEDNECYIFDGVHYNCNCSAPGSIALPEFGQKRCFSTLCRSRADIYACKSELDGNTCTLRNASVRRCTCHAPGYEIDPLTNDTCWRTKCASYEEEQCQTQVEGNTCTVVADIHACQCDAPGYDYDLTAPDTQRCIKTRKHGKHVRGRQRTNHLTKTNGKPIEEPTEFSIEETTPITTVQLQVQDLIDSTNNS